MIKYTYVPPSPLKFLSATCIHLMSDPDICNIFPVGALTSYAFFKDNFISSLQTCLLSVNIHPPSVEVSCAYFSVEWMSVVTLLVCCTPSLLLTKYM